MAGTNSKAELLTGGPAIILVEPQLGENIGTAARAMANFGLSEMRIVNPRDGWPNEKAKSASAKADHVIDNAKVFDTLEEALVGLNRVFATTARSRDMFVPVRGPEEAMQIANAHMASDQQCGILFGRERTGLKNEEVALADEIVTFPVNPAFASLNIAQAVLLMSYEWMRASNSDGALQFSAPEDPPATKDDLIGLFTHLENALENANFFRPPEKKEHMVSTLRALLQKGGYSHRDVTILRGVVGALEGRRTRHTARRQAIENQDNQDNSPS
ncbi:MAG: RNA methyltransferase [Hyphomicrobiales bacterium]